MEASNQLQHKTVAVAISRTRNNNYVLLQWALKNFMSEDGIMFKLLHVVPTIKMVPTPMGNRLPIDQVRDDVVAAFRKEEEWRTQDMLRPYKKMCTEKKIEAEVVVLEGDDVVEAIASDITESSISRLVIGASSRNPLMRCISAPASSVLYMKPPSSSMSLGSLYINYHRQQAQQPLMKQPYQLPPPASAAAVHETTPSTASSSKCSRTPPSQGLLHQLSICASLQK
ncbi:U-box domain-containing protein 35-like [Curcuma longa]|uniref:U-box domain-containing protein 35-like n=1 Tax=Curcuma longa TaxID=136217 RepID=UPI003D9F4173